MTVITTPEEMDKVLEAEQIDPGLGDAVYVVLIPSSPTLIV